MTDTLILVPGLLCDARVWRDQVRALGSRVDIAIADITLDDRIELMAERILREAPDYFAIAGHSLGGRVAQEVYRQAPGRVTRLALMSTGRRGVMPGEAERRTALVDSSRKQGVSAVADLMLTPSMHPEKQQDAALCAELRAMLERHGLEVLRRQFSAMLTRRDQTDLLPTITCPTLLACGRQDSYSPLDRHEDMHARIPGSTLAVIEGAGHMAPMEEPEQVTRAMARWLGL